MFKEPEFPLETLFAGFATILKPRTTDNLLQALSELPINAGCDIITLRKCRNDSYGLPVLDAQAYWCKPGFSVWQNAIAVDDESLAKLWILSAGPPVFIDNLHEFALFTDASREFYEQQGVVSLYRILIKRDGLCTGMLTVMWTAPRTFSPEYRATVEFMGWVLLPVLENIYARLENEQLARTIERLEQRLLETETEIHTLVHDLKQPLTSIMTTASLLTDYVDRLDKTQIAAKVVQVLQVSQGMNDWISSILLIAQARSEHPAAMTNVRMYDVLLQSITTLNGLISKSSARIDYTAVDDGILIHGEPVWLAHIWINLIGNACKYAGTAPIITISAADMGDRVRFMVQDNGPGIPQEKMHLVFEPFTRFSSDVSGTGIGLTTVKMLTEKMGGEVGLDSGKRGAGFWFTLMRGNGM